ncbi:MAG: hypothetical protein IT230_00120 [Flavobacteriales bacterium]|nr:hypothetical protein [Flavobacteriales bacterium]
MSKRKDLRPDLNPGTRVHAEQVSAFGALQALEVPGEWAEGLYLVMVRVEGQASKAARVLRAP